MPGFPFDGMGAGPISPGLVSPHASATSFGTSGSPNAPPQPIAPDLEEGEIPPLVTVEVLLPAAEDAVGGIDADDVAGADGDLFDDDLLRPDAVDVFMPPVRMQHFDHLAYGLVDPTPASSASHIRLALVGIPR